MQIYVTFEPSVEGQLELSKTMIEACLRDIDDWMLTNKLKLNNDKYKLLVLSPCRPLPLLNNILVQRLHVLKLQNQQGTSELCLIRIFLWNYKWPLFTNQHFFILETLHMLGNSYLLKHVKYLFTLLN
jgi:hypothetical protein